MTSEAGELFEAPQELHIPKILQTTFIKAVIDQVNKASDDRKLEDACKIVVHEATHLVRNIQPTLPIGMLTLQTRPFHAWLHDILSRILAKHVNSQEYLALVLEPFVDTLGRWTVLLMDNAHNMNTYASVLAQPQTQHATPAPSAGNPTVPRASTPPQARSQAQGTAGTATTTQPQGAPNSPAPGRMPAPLPSPEVRVAGLLNILGRTQPESKLALEALGFSRNMLAHANIRHMPKTDARGRDVMILTFKSVKEATEFMRGKGRKLQGLPSISMNFYSKYAYTPEARLRQVKERLDKLAPTTTNTPHGDDSADNQSNQVNPSPPQNPPTGDAEEMQMVLAERPKRSREEADLSSDNEKDSEPHA